jgi:hypothetical protein
MTRRLMIWALVAILLFGALLVLSTLLTLLAGFAFNCGGSDESGVVLGVDFCAVLYPMVIGGFWSSTLAVPVAGLALIVWLVALIVLLLLRRRRRAGAGRVNE